MYFNRFDIADAYYLFAGEWHRGMGSAEYRIFGRLHNIGYKAAPNLSKKSLSENGRVILANLIRKARKGQTVGR